MYTYYYQYILVIIKHTIITALSPEALSTSIQRYILYVYCHVNV